MSEPISTTTASTAVVTAGALTLLPGIDPGVVVGAFTGSLLFIMSDISSTTLQKIALFVVAFLGGALCAQWSATALSHILPDSLPINSAMAAIIASAVVVRCLQHLTTLNIETIWLNALKHLRGKK